MTVHGRVLPTTAAASTISGTTTFALATPKPSPRGLLFLLALLVGIPRCTTGASSRPVARKEHLPSSKFTKTTPLDLETAFFGPDASSDIHSSKCPVHIEIAWHQTIPGGIYAPPVIGKFSGERNQRQILIPTYKHGTLHMVDSDGHYVPGWPFSSNDQFHTGPLITDLNNDGSTDIAWVSTNGRVYLISGKPGSDATLINPVFQLPGLRVALDWFEGLRDESVEASMSLHLEGEDDHSVEVTEDESLADDSGEPISEQAAAGRTLLSINKKGRRAETKEGEGKTGREYTPEAKEAIQELKFWMSHSLETEAQDEDSDAEELAPQIAEIKLENASGHSSPSHVYVNPHVLGNPIIVDTEWDGTDDLLVIPVSYYFDLTYYRAHPDLTKHLPESFDLRNYVAAGVVGYDLKSHKVRWQRHLDLTTAMTELKASILAAPAAADVDCDGKMDIFVGTRLGFLYRMDASTGAIHKDFPLIMWDIQAQPAIGDLGFGDGQLQIVVTDAKGNVACFSGNGKELWASVVSGNAAQVPMIGDVDGDGQADVVFGLSNSPFIWALNGKTGKPLPNFPVKVGGRVIAPVLLAPLAMVKDSRAQRRKAEKNRVQDKGLHIIFPSFDGFLYAIEGSTGCTSKIDLGGEESYTMVLADDVLGHGKLDLIVSTFQGSMICLSTDKEFDTLSAVPTQFPRHGLIKRDRGGDQGGAGRVLELDAQTQNLESVTGPQVRIGYNIHGDFSKIGNRKVLVLVSLDGAVQNTAEISKSGEHEVTFDAPRQPGRHRISVKLIDAHGWQQEEVLFLDINTRAYRLVKWFVSLPFFLTGAAIVGFEHIGRTMENR